jgi:hypothetical protein
MSDVRVDTSSKKGRLMPLTDAERLAYLRMQVENGYTLSAGDLRWLFEQWDKREEEWAEERYWAEYLNDGET